MTASRPRVLVVGSGFGGYFAARKLGRTIGDSADVTLLSDTDGLLYLPLLPDVAAGTVDHRAILVPTAGMLPGVTAVRGRASTVDLKGHRVSYTAPDGSERMAAYDRLLLAPGSVTRLLDIPGLAKSAVGLKTAAEALYLRDTLLTALELANVTDDSAARRRHLTFLVVGAGYAGTELAAQLSLVTRQLLPRFPRVDPADVHWLLVDVADAVMPELGEKLGDSALDLLRRRGVDVRLGVSIDRIDPGRTVRLTDGTELPAGTIVWTAGVTPSPLIDTLGSAGLATDHGRLVVDASLAVPGQSSVFAIGDAAAVPDLTQQDGALCPPTAQHAMRQATAAARNITASLGSGTARPYKHHDLGLVVDLGGPDAAARPLHIPLRGRLAKAVTRGYHLYALPSGNRRLRVGIDWALAPFTGPPASALGLLSHDDARVTTAELE